MSRNTVRARLDFSFKGENYEIDRILDLDACAEGSDDAPDFHLRLAKAHDIDPYSYLYEVLASHEIVFSDGTGIAATSCQDGQFDWAKFMRDREDEVELLAVRTMAAETMGIADLDSQPTLKAALLTAYRAGKAQQK